MNQLRSSSLWILGGLCVLGILAWQQRSLHQLRTEMAKLESSLAVGKDVQSRPPERAPELRSSTAREAGVAAGSDPLLERRVLVLEESVARLDGNADHLMNRGMIPPSEAKLAEWRATFLNANVDQAARVSALRMLSRNDAVTPDVARVAATWLGSSTDASLTRRLLDCVRGMDDPTLKMATMNVVRSAADDRVRDRAIVNLREFVEDPQVEAVLWELVASGPTDSLRRRVQNTLRRVPMTDARAARLEVLALNPSVTLDEQLMSLRLLQAANKDIARVAPTLAQAAQSAADAETRLKYYAAFDDVNDPSFMLPLVEGAQDPNAEVRRRAIGALLDYRAEPSITELLEAMAESDPDPRVRDLARRVFRGR